MTASNPIEEAIPGRTHKWIGEVETNTDKVVGVVRFGSPTINSKPRNNYFEVKSLSDINAHFCYGFNIVPTQPFRVQLLGRKTSCLISIF